MARAQVLSPSLQLLMASSEVDQKFLGKYAQQVNNSNPFLSSWLYKVLGLSVILSKKLVRARRLRKLDPTRDTPSLQLYHHILWLAREGLKMVEQYIVPMTEGYIELKILAHKLRASFLHIYVLFHNQPSINQAAIPSFSPGKDKGVDRGSLRSSPNPMEGGPVRMLSSLPPGLAPVSIPKPSASFLLPAKDYIPDASKAFSRSCILSETLLSGSHPLRLSVKTEYSAYVYDCLHDGDRSRKIAQEAIRDVYNAQEGMDDEMFEDAAELVAILGRFMKRGLGSSGTSSTPRVGSVATPETPRLNTKGTSGSTPGTGETVVPAAMSPRVTNVNLDTLPFELLQYVLSLGSCETALALHKANKRCKQACEQVVTFKKIIENTNGHGGPVWRNAPLALEASWEIWARYALADDKAFVFPVVVDPSSISWIPQLMTSYHPILDHPHMLINWSPCELHHNAYVSESLNAHAIAFCWAMRCLSAMAKKRNTSLSATSKDILVQALTIKPDLDEVLEPDLIIPLFDDEFKSLIAVNQRSKAFLAVGLLSTILRRAIAQDEIRRTSRAVPYGIPTPRSIPFPTLLSLPPPFSSDVPHSLRFCHIQHTKSASFFEDGEWTGFYSYGRVAQSLTFDPPMRGIRFRAEQEIDSLRRFALYASGGDAVGDFDISGTVDCDTMQFAGRKTYTASPAGPEWPWRRVVLPCGFVGNWGSQGGSQGGWLWLWKTDWAAK